MISYAFLIGFIVLMIFIYVISNFFYYTKLKEPFPLIGGLIITLIIFEVYFLMILSFLLFEDGYLHEEISMKLRLITFSIMYFITILTYIICFNNIRI